MPTFLSIVIGFCAGAALVGIMSGLVMAKLFRIWSRTHYLNVVDLGMVHDIVGDLSQVDLVREVQEQLTVTDHKLTRVLSEIQRLVMVLGQLPVGRVAGVQDAGESPDQGPNLFDQEKTNGS
jgi:hypothetical protein